MRLISTLLLALSVVGLEGCGPSKWTHFTKDQNDLAMDNAYCKQFANSAYPIKPIQSPNPPPQYHQGTVRTPDGKTYYYSGTTTTPPQIQAVDGVAIMNSFQRTKLFNACMQKQGYRHQNEASSKVRSPGPGDTYNCQLPSGEYRALTVDECRSRRGEVPW